MLLAAKGPRPSAFPSSTCYEKVIRADSYWSADNLDQDTHREASKEYPNRDLNLHSRKWNGANFDLGCGLREKIGERYYTLLMQRPTSCRV